MDSKLLPGIQWLDSGSSAAIWSLSDGREVVKIFHDTDFFTAYVVFANPDKTELQQLFGFQNECPSSKPVTEITTLPGRYLRRLPEHEIFIHRTLGERWEYYGTVPFHRFFQFAHKSQLVTGILMPRARGNLHRLVNSMDQIGDVSSIMSEDLCDWSAEHPFLRAPDIAVIVFQVLVALHRLQQDYHFLHLDLRHENILMFSTKDLDPVSLAMDGFCVPDRGVLALIADFGVASITTEGGIRNELLDLCLCASRGKPLTSVWEEQEGYDTQIFFSFSPWSPVTIYHQCKPLVRFWQRLRKASLGDTGENNKEGYPSILSRVTPLQIIQEVFGTRPESWYDFRCG